MTWYDENYRNRQIVAIDVTGGTGVAATVDVEVEIPTCFDVFWDSIRSDFKDVVVTDEKGELVNFARKSGANYSNRVLILQLDGYGVQSDDSTAVCYVYFNYPDETTDHSTSVTITSPKKGEILLAAPHSRIVSSRAAQSATDNPIQSFTKASTDVVHVFFAISSSLARRITPCQGRNDMEGLSHVTIHSYDDTGTDDDGRYEVTETQFGSGFVRATFKGGDDGESYAIAVKMVTTLGQTIETRAILRVIDLLP